MAEREAFRMQRFLECDAVDAGFRRRSARCGIDVDKPVHARQIERDDSGQRAPISADRADNAGAAAKRNDRDIVLGGEGKERENFIGAARVEHGVGRSGRDRQLRSLSRS